MNPVAGYGMANLRDDFANFDSCTNAFTDLLLNRERIR